MRHVDRNGVEPPPSLVDPAGAGARERALAVKHYGVPGAGPFKFKAYKGADVIAALEKLFHKKCAYCESNYGATQPADIEHFRPKLAVYGADGHPGYWWLAGDWSNLLPSCIDCNRRRYHELYDADDETITAERVLELAGKKDFFPIFGDWRARGPFDILKYEVAKLIDPTRRDPALHFSWGSVEKDGRKISVIVERIKDGEKDPHAVASIEVLGLNRSGLATRRTALMERLECDHRALLESFRMATFIPPGDLPAFLPGLEERLVRFLAEKDGDKEYSACAKHFIDDRSEKLLVDLEALRARIRAGAAP